MSGMPTVKLAKQIGMLRVVQSPTIVIDLPAQPPTTQAGVEQAMTAELEIRKQQCAGLIQTLETIAENLQLLYEKAIVEYRQAIAKLAVEIARKILVQKVKDGDYRIETIVQEALNNAPTRQDIVIRLNPQDLAELRQMQQQDNGTYAGVKFVADPCIGQAQCVIETPKGKVESLIDEHLEQVSRALSKAV
jgi:flagellar biosynthesis/type III secretory pathway protein FliH